MLKKLLLFAAGIGATLTAWAQPATVPDPKHDNILSVFTANGPNMTFEHQNWGQPTIAEKISIDGKNVYKIENFNYEGVAGFDFDISEYTHMHVDYWTPNGEIFMFVPISLDPGTVDKPMWTAPEVKQNEWNSYDVALSKFSPSLNKESIKQIKFDNQPSTGITGYITNVYFWKGEDGGDTEPDTPVEPTPVATYKGIYHGIDNINDKDYSYTLNYTISYNDNKTLTISGSFDWGENGRIPGWPGELNIYFPTPNQTYTIKPESSPLEVTTKETYNANDKVNINFWIARDNGRTQFNIEYVVGSEGEQASISVKAEAQDVTYESANIAYTVTAPEGAAYTVYYKDLNIEGAEPRVATESPIQLTGLTERANYKYEVYAVLNKEEVESNHAIVEFITAAKDAREYVYSDYANTAFKDAPIIGEDPSLKRDHYFALPYSITFDKNNNAVVRIDCASVPNIDGLVREFWVNGQNNPLTQISDNIYGCTIENRVLDEPVSVYFRFAYAGGVTTDDIKYSKWGQEQEAPVLGAPVNMQLYANKTIAQIDDQIIVTTVLTDANGYYLPTDNVILEAFGFGVSEKNEDVFSEDYRFLTLKGHRGNHTIVAQDTSDSNIASDQEPLIRKIDLIVIASKGSQNLAADLEPEKGNNFYIYDLTEATPIEAVRVIFKDNYTTDKFTVTLTNATPSELSSVASYAASKEETFTPAKETNDHVFLKNTDDGHQYVVLRSGDSDAISNIQEVQIYNAPAESVSTAIESVTVEGSDAAAPVEYYNLNGQRVNNPAGGIFIRRQGSQVSKIIVR